MAAPVAARVIPPILSLLPAVPAGPLAGPAPGFSSRPVPRSVRRTATRSGRQAEVGYQDAVLAQPRG
ncbi:hypothetical protein, partial [Nitratidesulfovibrio liaohensis]|uniref:hypothetical protein n=1 Tax=Nitratidesulfovibrio liaohensis TaxID=2604158 RepID=UPI001AAFF59B